MRSALLIAVALVSGDQAGRPAGLLITREAPPLRGHRPALGLRFEENVGQADPSVRFVARYGRATVLISSDALVLLPPAGPARATHAERRALVEGQAKRAPREQPAVVRLRGSDPFAKMTGEARLAASITSFRGHRAEGLAIPSFERVRAHDVYPGVDVVFHAGSRGIEIDFEVAPGADPSPIAIEGAADSPFTLRADGSLAARRGEREVVLSIPRTFEVSPEGATAVSSSWRADATFALGRRRADRPLVIDPVLDMATYLGGSGDEVTGIGGVALDAKGDIYVAGSTTSPDLPVTTGAADISLGGSDDVLVAKTTADGKALLYCTYLGGSDIETYAYIERPIVVDNSGAVYVSGQTASADFPTTPGAYDTSHNGGLDAYVTKLAPDGRTLVYSTFLGGGGDDHGFGMAVDAKGAAYVGGWTKSLDFPITPGTIASTASDFVAKVSPSGDSLVYSTHAGGPTTVIFALAVTNGFATAVGDTRNDTFPVTPGAIQPDYGGGLFDVAVMQLDANGAAYRYATYLGGAQLDEAFAIDVDSAGNAVVVGDTDSSDFPTTGSALQPVLGGAKDAFVAKLDVKGQKLLYGSFIGSTGDDGATGVCVDPSGNAFVAGTTLGALPTKASCTTTGLGFVQMLEPTSNVRFSTLLPDQVFGVSCGTQRVVGFMSVAREDLATPGAFGATPNGGTDMLLFGLRSGSGPLGVGCKPCDGAFDAGTLRACDDPARPLCNPGGASGPLAGACTTCNAADRTRCATGKVCDLFTGECADPQPDAGADAGGEAGAGRGESADGGSGDAGAETSTPDASSTDDAGANDDGACDCRAVGRGRDGSGALSVWLALAALLALGRGYGRRPRH
ncbi:MAG: hypothetical protein JST00_28195 [Deltaproteobacteria bacterium]|nr:hypothetical protein [Deltaproteobacteria bacterium]